MKKRSQSQAKTKPTLEQLQDFRNWLLIYLTDCQGKDDYITKLLSELVTQLCDDDAVDGFKARLIASIADKDNPLLEALYVLRLQLKQFERRREAA
jgi:hypothetical protein